ncbi:MAG: MFS transporter, partial [Eubacteriales bacterium]|nr:MFS transporter [Eubacteriales bacterium]
MNSTNKSSRTLMAMLWIAYAAIYVGRKNFSVCMAGMIADGIIDKVVGGAAGTAFLAVYACGQLVHGIIGNRVSPKLMISVGLFGAGVANVLMGMAVTGSTVPRIWALCGFFASMLWSSVVRCISEWMPEDRQASAGVYISVTLPVGSIVSYIVCSVMMRYFGWRQAFFACAFILFAAGVVFLCGFTAIRHYIKDARAVNRNRREALSESKKDGSADVRAGGKSYGIVGMFLATGLICVIGGILFNGIFKDGLDLWVPT